MGVIIFLLYLRILIDILMGKYIIMKIYKWKKGDKNVKRM